MSSLSLGSTMPSQVSPQRQKFKKMFQGHHFATYPDAEQEPASPLIADQDRGIVRDGPIPIPVP